MGHFDYYKCIYFQVKNLALLPFLVDRRSLPIVQKLLLNMPKLSIVKSKYSNLTTCELYFIIYFFIKLTQVALFEAPIPFLLYFYLTEPNLMGGTLPQPRVFYWGRGWVYPPPPHTHTHTNWVFRKTLPTQTYLIVVFH